MLQMLEQQDKRFMYYEGDGLEDDKGSMTARENDWKVFYFYQNFQRYDENHKLCPRTSEILSRLSDRLLYGMVCFSHLEPGATVRDYLLDTTISPLSRLFRLRPSFQSILSLSLHVNAF